ncbi:MAG: hypothetical protein ACRD12_05035 [Acidimicrobiales bacterium]
MGNAGEKRKGRKHLPKVGTKAEDDYAIHHERMAIEEQMGLRPGGIPAKVVGIGLVLIAVIAILALIVLN